MGLLARFLEAYVPLALQRQWEFEVGSSSHHHPWVIEVRFLVWNPIIRRASSGSHRASSRRSMSIRRLDISLLSSSSRGRSPTDCDSSSNMHSSPFCVYPLTPVRTPVPKRDGDVLLQTRMDSLRRYVPFFRQSFSPWCTAMLGFPAWLALVVALGLLQLRTSGERAALRWVLGTSTFREGQWASGGVAIRVGPDHWEPVFCPRRGARRESIPFCGGAKVSATRTEIQRIGNRSSPGWCDVSSCLCSGCPRGDLFRLPSSQGISGWKNCRSDPRPGVVHPGQVVVNDLPTFFGSFVCRRLGLAFSFLPLFAVADPCVPDIHRFLWFLAMVSKFF